MPAPSRHRQRPPRDDTPATTARDLVARVLSAQASRFPEIEAVDIDTSRLDDREASLAHAIYDAAIRRWLTLEWLVSQHLSQPFRELEPSMKAALLVGSAQLVLFDRVPAHAAIDEAVEWAKRRIRPGAGGMVNAVLRKVDASLGERTPGEHPNAIPLAGGDHRPLVGVKPPADMLAWVAARYSMPEVLIRRWRRTRDRQQVIDVCTHGLTRPPTVLFTRYQTEPIPTDLVTPHHAEHHAIWTGSHHRLGEFLAERPDVWVQDPASTGAIESIRDLSPGTILDLCAGQGTKTRQLAAAFPDATIRATDVDRARYATLRDTFAEHPRVRVMPMYELKKEAVGAADLILLDVPCSNTGVLGRRVEARYRCTKASLERLIDIQRQLIADSIPLLAPRGSILYATCSIEPMENEAIVEWASQWHRFRADRVRGSLQRAPRGPTTSIDGSFSALLARG